MFGIRALLKPQTANGDRPTYFRNIKRTNQDVCLGGTHLRLFDCDQVHIKIPKDNSTTKTQNSQTANTRAFGGTFCLIPAWHLILSLRTANLDRNHIYCKRTKMFGVDRKGNYGPLSLHDYSDDDSDDGNDFVSDQIRNQRVS